jgi:hypothetical protein
VWFSLVDPSILLIPEHLGVGHKRVRTNKQRTDQQRLALYFICTQLPPPHSHFFLLPDPPSDDDRLEIEPNNVKTCGQSLASIYGCLPVLPAAASQSRQGTLERQPMRSKKKKSIFVCVCVWVGGWVAGGGRRRRWPFDHQ